MLYDAAYIHHYKSNRCDDYSRSNKAYNGRQSSATDELNKLIKTAKEKARQYVANTVVTAKGASAAVIEVTAKMLLYGLSFIFIILLIGFIVQFLS